MRSRPAQANASIARQRAPDYLSSVAFLAHVPLAVVATVAVAVQLVQRYRAGTPLLRQQLRLFVAAALLPIVAVPIVFTIGYDLGPWIFSATVLPLPFAIGFAVLARGLYDLRTAANRTLVWLTLSAVIAGVYALVIAGIGNRLDVRGATWLPWVAAAVVAVSFAPMRDALQRAVNRVTFGRWDEPYDVLAARGTAAPAGDHGRHRLGAEEAADPQGRPDGRVRPGGPRGRVSAICWSVSAGVRPYCRWSRSGSRSASSGSQCPTASCADVIGSCSRIWPAILAAYSMHTS